MDNSRDLELILKSRVPIVVIESHDESPLLELLTRSIVALTTSEYRPLFKWTITDGLQRIDIDLEPQRHNADPGEILRHIRSVDQPGIYVLLDFHPYLRDPVHVRLLKDICMDFDRVERTIVLVSHEIDLPPELERMSAKLDLAAPSETERADIVRSVADEWDRENRGSQVKIDPKAFELLVKNLKGLTASDTRRLARNAIYHDGAISKSDLPKVMQAKYELLNQGGLLSYEYDTAGFTDVGGLARFKRWLEQRRAIYQGKGDDLRLDPPKGVLLLGIQGCGKSLAAKAAAGVFGVPLLRLDFGALYNKYHGETERNLRDSLKTGEVMAPCVLWIDELEKGLAQGDSDSGTSRRILGSFLTWLSEKSSKVFVVATANDISALPPELVRKGRFDEIFFVDLPSTQVRADIFGIHLKKRGLAARDEDIAKLAQASDGFSGAEIEQAVVSALYAAHAQDTTPTVKHIIVELHNTRPLSVVMSERLAAMRNWAKGRTVPSD